MFIQDYLENRKSSLISPPVLTFTELAYCVVTAKRSTVHLYSLSCVRGHKKLVEIHLSWICTSYILLSLHCRQ